MVTFSSQGDNIWCVQPEDTTSVGQPRFHVPDGNSQMVSTNDMVEETWHNINIIVSWITRFKSSVAKFDRIMYVSSRVSAKTWPPPGTTITWGHHIRTLSPWRLEYHSTIPGVEVTSANSLHATDFSKLLKAECKITFLRIHTGFFHEPDIEWEFMKEQLNERYRDNRKPCLQL